MRFTCRSTYSSVKLRTLSLKSWNVFFREISLLLSRLLHCKYFLKFERKKMNFRIGLFEFFCKTLCNSDNIHYRVHQTKEMNDNNFLRGGKITEVVAFQCSRCRLLYFAFVSSMNQVKKCRNCLKPNQPINTRKVRIPRI